MKFDAKLLLEKVEILLKNELDVIENNQRQRLWLNFQSTGITEMTQRLYFTHDASVDFEIYTARNERKHQFRAQ